MNILETKRNSDTACGGFDVRGGGLLVGTGIRPFGLRGRFAGACALLCALLLSLPLLSSCIGDEMTDCAADSDAGQDGLRLQLHLTVPASAPSGTRTSGDGFQPGTALESYINIEDKDYKILIFDKEGKLAKEVDWDGCDITKSSDTKYTLTVNLEISDNETKAKLEKFKVMVLANWKSMQRKYEPAYSYPTFAGNSNVHLGEGGIYENSGDYNFIIAKSGETTPWEPSHEKKYYIPMFGISENIDLEYAAEMGKYGDGYATDTPIYMLRSLAKIEIIDNTQSGMSNVSFSHLMTGGRFIPDVLANPSWKENAIQVEKPSLPDFPVIEDPTDSSLYPMASDGSNKKLKFRI